MSVFVVLLCYETVCAGVSHNERKRAEQLKLETNFNSISDQTHGKNEPIVHEQSARYKRNKKDGGKQNLRERFIFKSRCR